MACDCAEPQAASLLLGKCVYRKRLLGQCVLYKRLYFVYTGSRAQTLGQSIVYVLITGFV